MTATWRVKRCIIIIIIFHFLVYLLLFLLLLICVAAMCDKCELTSVSIHSLPYSIGEYDISVCVSPPIPIRPLR